MLGWIRIYGHPCAGPAGPARALAGNRKSKKRKENIWIQALKTKTIRTALKFLKTHKNSTPESPKYLQLWFSLVQTFGDSGDHAFNQSGASKSAETIILNQINLILTPWRCVALV